MAECFKAAVLGAEAEAGANIARAMARRAEDGTSGVKLPWWRAKRACGGQPNKERWPSGLRQQS